MIMRSLQEVLQALIEKQTRLITVQGQLLDRIRKFGDEGASCLRHEVREIGVEIELLERELRALQPARTRTWALLPRPITSH
jgi:hypothetical protein